MASFEHSPSARAWERPRSRHCLTAHGPSAPERRTRKQFLPIAYFMATFAGTFRCRTRHRRARAKSHSTPHSEEKNFTNRIFHGEQCRGLAIYTQLLSLCLTVAVKFASDGTPAHREELLGSVIPHD